ncbi:MAG: serine protease, partial [Lentimonas sp.]
MRMSKTILFQLLIAVITITGYSAQTVSSDFVDGRIYLKLKPNSSIDLHNYDNSDASLNSIITEFDVTSTTRAFQSDAPTMRLIHRIEFTAITRIDELISSLSGLPYVEFAEKAPLFKLVHTPNDYNTDAKNHLNIISAQLAWDIEKGSQNIILAVVDNAVNHTHEDLIANRWVNTGEVAGNSFDDDLNGYTDDVYGYDVADGDGNTIPPSGGAVPFVHGTHVAGIAAATSNNATGISSIGYNLSIMSVKCSPDAGDGNTLPNAYE